MSKPASREEPNAIAKELKPKASDAHESESPVLARLIEEVRNERDDGPRAYDRVHNRHNR